MLPVVSVHVCHSVRDPTGVRGGLAFPSLRVRAVRALLLHSPCNAAEERNMAAKNAPEWMQVTAENLEAYREAQPQPITAEDRQRAVAEATRMAREAQKRVRERQGSQAPAVPDSHSDVDMVDAAALMTSQREYYRSGPGLTASTFEPQRHTWYVCGRPVQAPCLAEHLAFDIVRAHAHTKQ